MGLALPLWCYGAYASGGGRTSTSIQQLKCWNKHISPQVEGGSPGQAYRD